MTETKLSAGSVVHMTGRGAEQWTVNRIDAGQARAHVTSRDSGETMIVPLSDVYQSAYLIAAEMFEQAGRPHGNPRGPDCT